MAEDILAQTMYDIEHSKEDQSSHDKRDRSLMYMPTYINDTMHIVERDPNSNNQVTSFPTWTKAISSGSPDTWTPHNRNVDSILWKLGYPDQTKLESK